MGPHAGLEIHMPCKNVYTPGACVPAIFCSRVAVLCKDSQRRDHKQHVDRFTQLMAAEGC